MAQPGDLEGDYDFWFDGGAIELITGTTRFVFQDGTIAEVAVVPTLSLNINFRDGHVVKVQQQRYSEPVCPGPPVISSLSSELSAYSILLL